MTEADRQRFMAVLRWLCRKYMVDGKERQLPVGEDLSDYWEALRDVPIEDVEGGAKRHYAHSEFYPDRPGTLRKAAVEWRDANPRPVVKPTPAPPTVYEESSSPEFVQKTCREFYAMFDMAEKFGTSEREGKAQPSRTVK